MKKKFISVLTALMVLSMSTTVFAAPSPSTGTTGSNVTVASNATTAVTAVTGATSATVTASEAQEAAKAATSYVPSGYTGEVAAIIDLTAGTNQNANGEYVVSITVPTLSAGANVFVLHINANGTTEKLSATVADGGVVTFATPGFSKFAVVELTVAAGTTPTTPATPGYSPEYYAQLQAASATQTATPATTTTTTSPKTGDMTAVMSVMAVISLAGTAVCSKKVKFN